MQVEAGEASWLAQIKTESMQGTLENDVYSEHERKNQSVDGQQVSRRVIRSLCVCSSGR